MSDKQMQVELDRSWFYDNPEAYLSLPEFKRFEEISGLSLEDITSDDRETLQEIQKEWEGISVIFNEIRRQHFGFAFPYIIYTHTFHGFEAVSNHNIEVDKLLMGLDMCDSLRRRHIALSYGVIPYCLEKVHRSTGRALMLKNMGSGVGLDVINATKGQNGRVGKVLNYDTNTGAIQLGRQIVAYLENQTDELRPGVIEFVEKSMTKSDEPADVIIMVGVICGLQDFAAQYLLTQAYNQLNEGGSLIVSSSNHHMEKTDALASFLIQHLGTKEDASRGWSLNFRTKEKMEQILRDAGFDEIEIYSDTEYPGKAALPDEILYGVDSLPAKALGYPHSEMPLNLPPREILERGIAYNWIAVATKKLKTFIKV
jgi:hypothetical protein